MSDEAAEALEHARAVADEAMARFPDEPPGQLALLMAAASGVLAARQSTVRPSFVGVLMLALQAAAADEGAARKRSMH